MARAVPIVLKPPLKYDPELHREELVKRLCARIERLSRTSYFVRKLGCVENALIMAEGYKGNRKWRK